MRLQLPSPNQLTSPLAIQISNSHSNPNVNNCLYDNNSLNESSFQPTVTSHRRRPSLHLSIDTLSIGNGVRSSLPPPKLNKSAAGFTIPLTAKLVTSSSGYKYCGEEEKALSQTVDSRASNSVYIIRKNMPGPGPHMIYTIGSGQALMHVSNGRFGPHHCLTYAVNAFFGPDIGSFSQWLTSTLGLGRVFGDSVETWIHDPFYYVFILGLPLSLLYSWASRFVLHKGIFDSFSCGVPLTARQCFLLIFAGSLSHFFLDHLFEENGHSIVYTWILSTGWWKGRAPVNPDAVVVTGLLCTTLLGGFIYIYRGKSIKSSRHQYKNSSALIMVVAVLYCLWCVSQIYLVKPRRPAVGEEADLGVLVFLAVFFFLPHWLCILSMNSLEFIDAAGQLPLSKLDINS